MRGRELFEGTRRFIRGGDRVQIRLGPRQFRRNVGFDSLSQRAQVVQ